MAAYARLGHRRQIRIVDNIGTLSVKASGSLLEMRDDNYAGRSLRSDTGGGVLRTRILSPAGSIAMRWRFTCIRKGEMVAAGCAYSCEGTNNMEGRGVVMMRDLTEEKMETNLDLVHLILLLSCPIAGPQIEPHSQSLPLVKRQARDICALPSFPASHNHSHSHHRQR